MQLSAYYIQVFSWKHNSEQKSQESLYSWPDTLVGKIITKINKAYSMFVISAKKKREAGKDFRKYEGSDVRQVSLRK